MEAEKRRHEHESQTNARTSNTQEIELDDLSGGNIPAK